MKKLGRIFKIIFLIHVALIVLIFAVMFIFGENTKEENFDYIPEVGTKLYSYDSDETLNRTINCVKDSIHNRKKYRLVTVHCLFPDGTVRDSSEGLTRKTHDTILNKYSDDEKEFLDVITTIGGSWGKNYSFGDYRYEVLDTNSTFQTPTTMWINLLKVKLTVYNGTGPTHPSIHYHYYHKEYDCVVSTYRNNHIMSYVGKIEKP